MLILLILSKFGNMVIQLNFFLLGMLSGPEKIVRRIVFLFFIFSIKFKMADESHVALKSLPASHICSKEATYPGHMLIRFWCDSDITFLRVLHTHYVTVLYFSIINLLCGAGGDASFAPQANLVKNSFLTWAVEDIADWYNLYFFCVKYDIITFNLQVRWLSQCRRHSPTIDQCWLAGLLT